MTSEGWLNLALTAVMVFYILQIGFDIFTHNMCGNLGIDYCAYWSAGKLIHNGNYTEIYNLDLLTQFQKSIYPQGNTIPSHFQGVPFVYLPVFVFPFQILSILSLDISFGIWTLLNLVGLILYLRFFTKKVTGHSLPIRLLLLFILSLPVFLNLFWGQVNIWLGICAGEFMRAILSEKPFRAGLWLGGWLFKPQLLILILPLLLIHRSVKAITGFSLSTLAVLIVSFCMIKTTGFISLLHLLLGSAQGGSASNPEIMMNWRMLGLHISSLINPILGWVVALVGAIVTALFALIIFRKPFPHDPTKTTIALLGIFAATGAVTWHAHFSMSIILIPPLIYLAIHKCIPMKVVLFWVFMPTGLMLILYFFAALAQVNILPTSIAAILNLITGLRGLILNILMLAWAAVVFSRTNIKGCGTDLIMGGVEKVKMVKSKVTGQP